VTWDGISLLIDREAAVTLLGKDIWFSQTRLKCRMSDIGPTSSLCARFYICDPA